MKYSDDLFQLIKSLSRPEKRYFRLFATRYNGKKKYMQLFNAIDRQEMYDEERLRIEFEGDAFANQFHVAKNYLYKLILRSLRGFYSESSLRARLQEMIREVEILYERGLFKQAQKLLNQVKKGSKRLDEPYLDLAIHSFRHRLSGKMTSKLEKLDDLQEERMAILRRLEEVYECDYLVEKLGNLCTSNPIRGVEHYAQLDTIISHPLLANEPTDAPFHIRKQYLWGHATYHYGKKEYSASLEYMRRLVGLFQEHKDLLQEFPNEYLAIVDNFLILLGKCGAIDEYIERLKGLEKEFGTSLTHDSLVSTRTTSLFLKIFYSRKLTLYCSTGNFRELTGMAPSIKKYLEEYQEYRASPSRTYITLYVAYAFFAVGNYESACTWINTILNKSEPPKGRSVWYSARLLSILLHYELGNIDLLHSLLRSLRNQLTNAALLGPSEQAILSFFERVINLSPTEKVREEMKDLKNVLTLLEQSKGKQTLFHTVHITIWLESKITGKDFAGAVKDHADQLQKEPKQNIEHVNN